VVPSLEPCAWPCLALCHALSRSYRYRYAPHDTAAGQDRHQQQEWWWQQQGQQQPGQAGVGQAAVLHEGGWGWAVA
jgi:hypothetical protein